MDHTQVDDLFAAAPLGCPSCQPHGIGDLRVLQLADHGLFVTICRHHLSAPKSGSESPIGWRGRHQRLAAQPPMAGRASSRATGDPRSAPVTTLGYDHGTVPGSARGTGRGTACWIIPARPVLLVRFPVSSVQPARTVHGNVLMVRRRSTVRFRNGAPGRDSFSNDSNDWRGTSRERRSSAPIPPPRPAEGT
jgi:hypothetical protein